MAIKSWDGTTERKIKTIKSWDGTTERKIKEVKSFDGTIERIVYKSEAIIFPGSNPFAGGWDISVACGNGTAVSSSVLSARSSTNCTFGKVYSKIKIDLTSVSSIVFTCSVVNKSGNAAIGLGVHSNWNDVFGSGGFTKCVEPNAAGDYTLDVSDITGSWFVILSAWGSTGGSRVDVTQIKIS